MPVPQNLDKIFSDVTKTFLVISGLVVFGLIIISRNSGNNSTTAIFWAMACLASGGVIGFLFGIPRVLQDNPTVAVNNAVKPVDIADNSANNTNANNPNSNTANTKVPTAYRIMVNTNLEQISDWLTKIIVGLGLIELRNVPGYLNSLSGYFAVGLGTAETQTIASTQSLASAIIIYFVVIGFLGVYLMTRIYLAQVFSRADRQTQETEKLESARITLEEANERLSEANKRLSDQWEEFKASFKG